MRHLLSLVPVSLSLVLAACSSDDSSTKQPAPASTGTSATEPAKGTPATPPSGTGSLGPSCTAYVACCKEVAAKQPAAGASCDTLTKTIDDAQKKGTATSSFEPGCKSGVDAFQTAGFCK
jgi:ABC-type Fe3+-hydroxamate transport system substrate-binding protein